MTPRSQSDVGEPNPGYVWQVANPRQTEYNVGVHAPNFVPPYPMTLGYSTGTIPAQPGFPPTPAIAPSLGIPMAQSDNQQGGTHVMQFTSDTSFVQLPETNIYPPNPAMLQQSGIGINMPPYPIEGDAMMADAGMMPGCLSAPGQQHPENMTCPVTVAKRRGNQKRRFPKKKGPRTGTRNGSHGEKP